MLKLFKKGDIKSLSSLVLFVVVVIPLILLISGVVIFNKTNRGSGVDVEKVTDENVLIPSQILSDKAKYNQQEITVRGRLSLGPAVCEKKECPSEDSCCGCPAQRDVILNNANEVLTLQGETLKLLEDDKSLCQRKPYSCEYDCGDWQKGTVYDVNGKFYAEPPPPGWKLSLNYYFQVNGKALVKKASFIETFGNLINEIVNKIASFKTSGQYVLP